jgi:hypothetical protein
MTEALVKLKAFKRDYARVSPMDHNTVHPHSRLGYRSPENTLCFGPALSGLTGLLRGHQINCK